MAQFLASIGIILRIALRNLVANRWKTALAGSIIGAGAFIGVFGASLLDAVDRAMRGSIIGSVTGHIQVYSSASTGALDVMGGATADLAPLSDFAKVKAVLRSVPNVSSVVPMAIGNAAITLPNVADQALRRLRDAVTHRGDAAEYASSRAEIERIVRTLRADADGGSRGDGVFSDAEMQSLREATAPEFWADFDSEPLSHLETLENRIAPLVAAPDSIGMRYLGTDPAAFSRSFERMKIVDGSSIPPGQRGFMLSKFVYEQQLKLRAARGLDAIELARRTRGARIDGTPELSRIVRENAAGIREIVLQLDDAERTAVVPKLRTLLQSKDGDLEPLLSSFFEMTDADFDERYGFFYRELGPALELYRVEIGDTVTLRATTRGGYVRSLNLKVYGTYAFRGLEGSPQAGLVNLMDLVSFRELYGFVTEEGQREIDSLRVAVGSRDLDRKDVESELFGAAAPAEDPAGGAAEVHAPEAPRVDDPAPLAAGASRGAAAYDPAELQRGLVLSAAVMVSDESTIPETIRAIEAAGARSSLPLKAVSWQEAAGFIGQFAFFMRIVLYAAVLIILFVSLVVINNALVMATLERVREIGTLRAIGAQRTWVLGLLMAESTVAGLLAGTAGAALAAVALGILGRTGIPASSDALTFFFAGPSLHPSFAPGSLGLVLLLVLGVGGLSGLYPAWIAMRVSPREAMQSAE